MLAPAQAVIDGDERFGGETVTRAGLSAAMLHALDTIHDRIESPPSKLHRAVEPWSSYVVLCASVSLFAVANASVESSRDVLPGHERLVMATVLASSWGNRWGSVDGRRRHAAQQVLREHRAAWEESAP